MPKLRTAAIIGTGLIGGSLGLALKNIAGVSQVNGFTRRPETGEKAIAMGAIDVAFSSIEAAVKRADIVFIATPVSDVVGEAKKAIKAMRRGAILTDVASVKAPIVAALDETAATAGIRFIGGHPMAGSELSGIEAANKDLFRNAAYILTPTEHTDPDALKETHGLLQSIGARVFTVNPNKHDRVIAAISHLPHVMSASLVNVAKAEQADFANVFKLAAGGFYDMTRIAGSSPGLWTDICLSNRDAINELIDKYKVELDQFSSLLKNGDAAGVRLKLEQASSTRQELPRLKPEEAPLVIELTIAVPNHPKVLGDITMCVADLGVNIEDIQIVHSTEADGGFLKLAILTEAEATRVADALEEKGYIVRKAMRLK